MTPVYSKLDPADKPAFIFQNFLVFCGISILIFLLLTFAGGVLTPILTGLPEVPYFRLFSLFLLFNLPTFPVEYIYLLHKKPVFIAGWGMAAFGLQLVVVFLPVFLGYGLEASLTGLAALAFLKWLWTAATVWHFGALSWRPDLIRKYLHFAGPLILNVWVSNLVLMFDNWLVGWHYHDPAVFAVFRYGSRELPLAQALATALGVALIPRLAEDLAGGLADMKAMTRKLGHLLFPVAILLLLVSKPLFPLVFNPAFASSAPLFNIYLLITASRMLLPNSIILAMHRPRVILWVSLAEMLVKILLSLVFIYAWGLPGLAWSAVIAYWVEKGGLMWYLNRQGIAVRSYVDLKWYGGYVILMGLVYLAVQFY
jgi:O-antigen/teichoic acid export membrane protein